MNKCVVIHSEIVLFPIAQAAHSIRTGDIIHFIPSGNRYTIQHADASNPTVYAQGIAVQDIAANEVVTVSRMEFR